ncbi:MAG: M15 family metallopeptidase [Verrucomicrobiota bacterium]|nr:M15 family metallopeptidase [Verrucomicrobiota bacterium]
MVIRQILGLALLTCACTLVSSRLRAGEPELVDLHTVDPTIVIELRYAGAHNIAGRPLYPPNMPALVRPSVAAKLVHAQNELLPRGFRLKIWDAWRPKAAHDQLWAAWPDKDYVGNPADGIGSLHTWGVAVDATMVDNQGHDVTMPTDFDAFTPEAMLKYTGRDPFVEAHLHTLQRAMSRAGFMGMRTEWWHFISRGWQQYHAVNDATKLMQPPAPAAPQPVRAAASNSAPVPTGGASGGAR